MALRDVLRPQSERGRVAIETSDLDEHSRDGLPPMLRRIPLVLADRSARARRFESLQQGILPGVPHTQGRPGREL